MELPFTLTFEPPTRKDAARLFRKPLFWLTVIAAIGGGLGARQLYAHVAAERRANAGDIRVSSEPSGAQIQLDGHASGRTPATIPAESGDHQVRLELAGYSDPVTTVEVTAAQTAVLDQRLWLRSPLVERLRPLLPGASIADVRFLSDGALTVLQQLPGNGWQLWLRQADGSTQRVGPPSAAGRLVMSQDGQRLAYLGVQSAGQSGNSHLDQLSICQPDGQNARPVYQLRADSGQELTDVSWSPDARRLIVFARDHPTGGGATTRVFMVDSESSVANDLVTLPADVVAGSTVWNADGQQVAFLTKTGDATSLFVLGLQDGDARYLADVSSPDAQVAPFAPIAWASQSSGLAYAAPDQLHPSSSWLASKPTPAFFAIDQLFGTPRRLGAGDGESPVWLDRQTLLGLARKPHDGPLVVQQTKLSGESAEITALPLKPNAYAARWDVLHGQALVAVPGTTGGFSTNSDYWLVHLQGAAQ